MHRQQTPTKSPKLSPSTILLTITTILTLAITSTQCSPRNLNVDLLDTGRPLPQLLSNQAGRPMRPDGDKNQQQGEEGQGEDQIGEEEQEEGWQDQEEDETDPEGSFEELTISDYEVDAEGGEEEGQDVDDSTDAEEQDQESKDGKEQDEQEILDEEQDDQNISDFEDYTTQQQYLNKFNLTGTREQYENICYDQYVDKYKGNDYRWKDPQVVFYKIYVLKDNIRRIKAHNSKPGISYILGINQYADLTLEEFRKRYFSNQTFNIMAVSNKSQEQINADILSHKNFGVEWDCFDFKPINTGSQCQSLYAFSVLGAIQITMKMHGINTRPLSVQEILSCAQSQKKQLYGCGGGRRRSVFEYVQKMGVGPSSLYKYTDINTDDTSSCNKQITQSKSYKAQKIFIESFSQVPANDCSQLVYRLRFRAISAIVDGSDLALYRQGVLELNKPYKQLKLDTEVTVVGYDPGSEAFKIKHYRGVGWGVKGYGWVGRSLGVCAEAYYAVLRKERAYPETCD